MQSLSLILPVWNEESFIADIVHDIEKVLEKSHVDYELLLAENGSTDRSLMVVQNLSQENRRCRVVIRPKGYGSAVIGGLQAATKELVGYMPSDGQIEPAVLVELLEKMASGQYDLVKINRTVRESRARKLLSYFFNLIARFFFGLRVKDVNGSPKLFLKKHLSLLSLKSNANLIDTELMAKARRLNWRIGEVVTRSLPRAGGKSHINPLTIFYFVYELIRLRFDSSLRRLG